MPAEVPSTMNAIEIAAPGGPEVLRPVSMTVPRPGPGELLVQVKAAGVNRPDVLQRKGAYPPPPGAPLTPGLEVAGTIVLRGDATRRFAVGDKVCALVPGGGYAEYCLVAEPNAMPVPKGFTLIEAAAVPETFMTVWTNVFERGRLKRGETFLVHGGSSGIGTTAIMLAEAFGATVFATAGSDEKCKACRELGAHHAINYRESDFADEVLQLTGGRGADVILDMVGGSYVEKNLRCAARDGRLVSIAFLQGSKVEIDLMPMMLKRLTLTGSTLRARSVEEKAAICRALENHVWPLFESRGLKPRIYKTFPLAEASRAHALMESSEHIGKIVLLA
jgi:putative PIG3 family NAD(P)H quinone oxidoreductase